jgi:hypothetical protein
MFGHIIMHFVVIQLMVVNALSINTTTGQGLFVMTHSKRRRGNMFGHIARFSLMTIMLWA